MLRARSILVLVVRQAGLGWDGWVGDVAWPNRMTTHTHTHDTRTNRIERGKRENGKELGNRTGDFFLKIS